MCKPSAKGTIVMSSSTTVTSTCSDHEFVSSSEDSSEVVLNRLTLNEPQVDSLCEATSPSRQDELLAQLDTIDEKLKRVSKFLQEIQALSPVCEDATDDVKEKQVFIRRILQVSTELQDAKDVVTGLCAPPRLSPRQFDLLVSSSHQENILEFDASLDPSVRFFGVDWQLVFGKCLSLSLNVGIFRGQILDDGMPIDLVLVHSILKDLARLEVDVTSHGEAVVNGRLSKSQQRLIKEEQSRLTSLAVPAPHAKVSKSRSFRESGSFRSGQRGQQRQISKYKKNKTTDLNRLTESASTQEHLNTYSYSSCPERKTSTGGTGGGSRKTSAGSSCGSERKISSDHEALSNEWEEVIRESKRKTSFIQNVSSLFKNIR